MRLDGCPGDAKLANDVRTSFAEHSVLQPPNLLKVQAVNHVIYLYGLVDTDLERQIAESVALGTPGVTKVVNSIVSAETADAKTGEPRPVLKARAAAPRCGNNALQPVDVRDAHALIDLMNGLVGHAEFDHLRAHRSNEAAVGGAAARGEFGRDLQLLLHRAGSGLRQLPGR